MAIKWADFRARLYRVLDDTVRDDENRPPTWSDDDMLDYYSHAAAEISSQQAQEKTFVKQLEGAESALELPDDILALGPVFAINGSVERLLTPRQLEPGTAFTTLSSAGIVADYYEWPTGTLNFFSPLQSGLTLRVHYWGEWDLPRDDADLLRIPRKLEEPFFWLLQEQAMSKAAYSAASLGQYKTKNDSGRPEDNPLIAYARYCRRQYERLMVQLVPQDRTGWESK